MAKHTDVRLSGMYVGYTVYQSGFIFIGVPGTGERVPLQHHAMAAKINNGDGGGVIQRHGKLKNLILGVCIAYDINIGKVREGFFHYAGCQ